MSVTVPAHELSVVPPPVEPITDSEWEELLFRFSEGALIPFLGAGASAYNYNPLTKNAPPPGRELLRLLSANSRIDGAVFCGERRCGSLARCTDASQCEHARVDLARVASYSQTKNSREALNRKLVELLTKPQPTDRAVSQRAGRFAAGAARVAFDPLPLHNLLARIASRCPMLIITTNYDTLIEDAFDNYGVPFEVMATPNDNCVANVAPPEPQPPGVITPQSAIEPALSLSQQATPSPFVTEAGAIWHRLGKTPVDDDRMQALPSNHPAENFRRVAPNSFSRILLSRSLIYKIHGTLRRVDSAGGWDGDFLIAEEDYVRFLGRLSHSSDLIPPAIITKLRARPDGGGGVGTGGGPPRSRMLFMGYGLNDWNMRVLLDSLGVGHGSDIDPKHYLIDRSPNTLQSAILSRRDFRICAMDLADFANQLQTECEQQELIPEELDP
jgi:hypothetical protein